MKEPFLGYCNMCLQGGKVRNVNLYTRGSEGTDLCHDCEMSLVELIRAHSREAVVEKIKKLREGKVAPVAMYEM